ncbi:MAG: VOC family protein [Bryobacteraceae bacterium]|nr:VOC family protein [Bryobacteraceae bacterium]
MTLDVPGFLFIDHVAIAVPAGSLAAQVRAYENLGFRVVHREEVGGADQVREVLLQIGSSDNLVQLLEPLSADSPVQKLMDRNGGKGGFAHIAYRVGDAHRAFAAMKSQGYRILDEAPRPGSRGTTIFFVHPKSTEDAPLGYLIEVVEANAPV